MALQLDPGNITNVAKVLGYTALHPTYLDMLNADKVGYFQVQLDPSGKGVYADVSDWVTNLVIDQEVNKPDLVTLNFLGDQYDTNRFFGALYAREGVMARITYGYAVPFITKVVEGSVIKPSFTFDQTHRLKVQIASVKPEALLSGTDTPGKQETEVFGFFSDYQIVVNIAIRNGWLPSLDPEIDPSFLVVNEQRVKAISDIAYLRRIADIYDCFFMFEDLGAYGAYTKKLSFYARANAKNYSKALYPLAYQTDISNVKSVTGNLDGAKNTVGFARTVHVTPDGIEKEAVQVIEPGPKGNMVISTYILNEEEIGQMSDSAVFDKFMEISVGGGWNWKTVEKYWTRVKFDYKEPSQAQVVKGSKEPLAGLDLEVELLEMDHFFPWPGKGCSLFGKVYPWLEGDYLIQRATHTMGIGGMHTKLSIKG